MTKGNAPESTHYIIAQYNIGVYDELFNIACASWGDAWLLLTIATCHMTFRREVFKIFNENIDGTMCFVEKYSLKLLGISILRLNLPIFLDFFFFDVLYLPEML